MTQVLQGLRRSGREGFRILAGSSLSTNRSVLQTVEEFLLFSSSPFNPHFPRLYTETKVIE